MVLLGDHLWALQYNIPAASQPVFAHLLPEIFSADAQNLGAVIYLPVVLFEYFGDALGFTKFQVAL